MKVPKLISKFANIHPFADGNGRTSRLLMNLELMKHGYLPIIIEQDKRFRYYEVLDTAAVNNDYGPFIDFVKDYEHSGLIRHLQLINRHQELDGPER
ncbi:Fic family protein [Gracilibacillus caseinilyticus]|uniref:Fic family protein n=2 Tax=Gracilibacillus caseinilyticus TaxID=2932256 RepID=A0ABY4F0K2_9BACI|nr:Fic family protein [Gracilibacillus caseinilyticus]UOQ49771.1 Fic family protein [Gracilibacillus caseinilyticus]